MKPSPAYALAGSRLRPAHVGAGNPGNPDLFKTTLGE